MDARRALNVVHAWILDQLESQRTKEQVEERRNLGRKLTGRLTSHRTLPPEQQNSRLKPPSWWGTDEEESEATLRALGIM